MAKKATEKEMEELLLVTADAADSRGFDVFAEFLRDLAADERGMKIPKVVARHWLDMHYRAVNTVVDPLLREDVISVVKEAFHNEEHDVSNEAAIIDNEEDGYWVTCVAFVHYFDAGVEEEQDDVDG